LIESIEPVDDGHPQLFRLNVSIKKGWRIPTDSIAQITAASVLSAVVINIGDGDADTYIAPGSQIPSKEPANLIAVMTEAAAGFSEFLLDTLKPQITTIVGDLNATMDQVKLLLSDENTARIGTILVNLEGVSSEVDELARGLRGTTQEVDHTLAGLQEVVAQINDLLAVNEGNLTHSIVDLHESLEAVARHADAIANNLETTTRNMDEFSQQIRQDPGVILRGRSGANDPAGSQ
jgi:phospholipid/cholesterol/gamma-HCH transport system substrate-binding protein